MPAFADIIDFLLRLLGDDAARAEFEQDPDGALQRADLEGVTAQDIRDARLQLADSGAVSATDDGAGATQPDGDDPVREIGYTTQHYAGNAHVDDGGHTVPQTTTLVTIDDRDTLFFQSISDDDVTVTDNSVTIDDSFNEDDSQVTAIQATDSFNTSGSFNSDDDVVAIQDNDVNGGDEAIAVDIDAAEPVDGADAEPALDDDDAVDSADDSDTDGDTDDEPADDPADLPTDDALVG